MKTVILFAFLGLLGVSLVGAIQGTHTGAEKSVADLIASFETQQIQDIAGGQGIPTGAEKMVKDLIALYEKHTQQNSDDDDEIAGSDTSTEANFGSAEKYNAEMSPRMKSEIADIEAAFKSAVSSAYEGMSNRKLWKELMKKQKQLTTAKTQMQHLLNMKQEKLNKLHGKPSRFNIPSKELSKAILRYIDEIVAYRPVDLSP